VSKANARFRRSIYIGVIALGSLVWVASDQFGIPRESVVSLLVFIAVGAGIIVALAACLVGAWILLRRVFNRR